MFVTIKMDGKCPDCDGKIEEWQTKDLVIDGTYPVANFGQVYKVNNRMSAEMYAYCNECKKEVNLKIKKGMICA